MADLVADLRHTAGYITHGHLGDGEVSSGLLVQAADEIERLQADNNVLRGMIDSYRQAWLRQSVTTKNILSGVAEIGG